MKYRIEKQYNDGIIEKIQIYFYEEDFNEYVILFEKDYYSSELYLKITFNELKEIELEKIYEIIKQYLVNNDIEKMFHSLLIYTTECEITI